MSIFVKVFSVLLLVGLSLLIFLLIRKVNYHESPKSEPPDPEFPLPPSPSKAQTFSKAAVCSDAPPCSAIGRNILQENGSAVDAAIATLFCNGLVGSQSMGIGGGFLMVLYDTNTKSGYALNAREAAPAGARDELYRQGQYISRRGALAVAVPGELKGYWEAHQRFGRLPWKRLVEPTIELCEEGYEMTKHQRDSLDYRSSEVRKDPLLSRTFVNATTGAFLPMGSTIRLKELCQTLRVIASEGGNAIYTGSLAYKLVDDIRNMGGIITNEDMAKYDVRWSSPITTKLSRDLTVLGVPPPSSGVILAFILNVLDGFNFRPGDFNTTEEAVNTYHRIVEAFKFGFARRGELGDPRFVDLTKVIESLTSPTSAEQVRNLINRRNTSGNPADYGADVWLHSDQGTAHVSVIDAQGNAVSVTSSINLYFGAGVTSSQTGIILNSGMDDFSFPFFPNYFGLGWSPANRLQPGKQSLSSMCPTIVLEGNKVRLVIGASGGTKITTAVALVIMRHLWLGEDLKRAVDASRIHHQLVPPEISYEYGLLQDVKKGLIELGHNLTRYRDRGSIVCALAKIGQLIHGNSDFRKGGEVFGF